MNKFFIHNEIAVDLDRAETIFDNGLKGDARQLLRAAPVVRNFRGTVCEVWLDTNGGPMPLDLGDKHVIESLCAEFNVSESVLSEAIDRALGV